MLFPISQVTTFLLVVHLGLGCCLHHAHTYARTCSEAIVATTDSCGCATGHEGSDAYRQHNYNGGPSTGQETNPRHHSCDGDRCSFLRLQPSPLQRDQLRFHSCPLGFTFSLPKSELFPTRQMVDWDHLHCDGSLPVRAHLLFRVLLI